MAKRLLPAVLLICLGGVPLHAQECGCGERGLLTHGLSGAGAYGESAICNDPRALSELFSGDGQGREWWINPEALYWWITRADAPPLATTGSVPSPGPGAPGSLGNPDTVVLFGGSDSVTRPQGLGARLTAGLWFDEEQQFGMEGGYFFLNPGNVNAHYQSAGDPLLARPIIAEAIGAEDSEFVAIQLGQMNLVGDLSIRASTKLQGSDANFLVNLLGHARNRVDMLIGFKYLELMDSVRIQDISTDVNNGSFVSQTILRDSFEARNPFYGGQLGLRGVLEHGRLFVKATTKVAVGSTMEIVGVDGWTSINTLNGVQPDPIHSGLLAGGANIGRHQRNHFGVVPEAGLEIGFVVTKNIRVSAGYNVLYWSDVARAGQQINRIVGDSQPQFAFKGSEFWAQGVTGGLEFRY